MDNFSNAEKLNIEIEIDSIIDLLSGNVSNEEINIPEFISVLSELRGGYLNMDKKNWFNQLQEVFVVFLSKPDFSVCLTKIKLRFISLWHTLSAGEKLKIPNPAGKRIVYPLSGVPDARDLDEIIKRAIVEEEIENCSEMTSMLQEEGNRLNYFSSDGLQEPIFELNYNSKEGVIDFFNTSEKYESLRKFVLMIIHDAVIKV